MASSFKSIEHTDPLVGDPPSLPVMVLDLISRHAITTYTSAAHVVQTQMEQELEDLQAFLMDLGGDLASLDDDEFLAQELGKMENKSVPLPLMVVDMTTQVQLALPSPPCTEEGNEAEEGVKVDKPARITKRRKEKVDIDEQKNHLIGDPSSHQSSGDASEHMNVGTDVPEDSDATTESKRSSKKRSLRPSVLTTELRRSTRSAALSARRRKDETSYRGARKRSRKASRGSSDSDELETKNDSENQRSGGSSKRRRSGRSTQTKTVAPTTNDEVAEKDQAKGSNQDESNDASPFAKDRHDGHIVETENQSAAPSSKPLSSADPSVSLVLANLPAAGEGAVPSNELVPSSSPIFNAYTQEVTEWDCPCGAMNNFASRVTCRQCNQTRPSRVARGLPNLGAVISGIVSNLSVYGAHIDIGASAPVLVPSRELRRRNLQLSPRDSIYVKMARIVSSDKGVQILGSLREIDPHTGMACPEVPGLGSVHQGVVVNIHRNGAFVEIPGYTKHGFLRSLHESIMPGQSIQVEVIEVKVKEGQSLFELGLYPPRTHATVPASPCAASYGHELRNSASQQVAAATASCACGIPVNKEFRFCPGCGRGMSSVPPPAVASSISFGLSSALQAPQYQPQSAASHSTLNISLDLLNQIRLDRSTLIHWYTNYAAQFDTIVPGFLVRVSDVDGKYDVGRVVSCQNGEPYEHPIMGSLVCSKILLVKVCCSSELKKYPLYMVSSQPFKNEEFITYQLRVAINPNEALVLPSEMEQYLRIKHVMLNLSQTAPH